VTREQIIVLGFIVAAFVAGWLVRALTGERDPDPTVSSRLAAMLEERSDQPAPARSLSDEVSDALRSDAANDTMLGAVTGNREEAALTALELDLADWGFTYGVAWARARERAPGDADEAIARQGLDAAETVFRAYTGEADWTQQVAHKADGSGNAPSNGSATRSA
jgi:hypothetical protein